MIELVKYKNRKLYDKTHSKYVTLENIAQYVEKGIRFKVTDNTNKNKDITNETLVKVLNTQLNTSLTSRSTWVDPKVLSLMS